MASSYTSLLGLALPVTGELSGSWGDVVNDSITSLLDTAVAGTTTLSTDGDVTLSTTTGASNQARQAILLCSGARTALRTITAPAQSKIYTVINATTGGYSVKVVGAGPTTGVTIVAGESAVIAWNGSDFIKVSNTGGSASFTNVTVSGTTTLSGLTASTALALNSSKEVVSVTNTGTGNNVLATSPTLVTPALGTPSSVTLTNATGLPVATGISGLGTGIATALAVNVGSAGAPVINGGALGTPSSGTVTNLTGTASININGTVGATTPTTGAFTTLTTSSTVTLNGGTANGVAYLNGSKVLTTGSELTFDGTNLSATGTTTVNSANSSSVGLVVKGETGNGIRQRFIGQAASGQNNWQIGASITAAGEFSIMPSTAADGTTFSSSAYNITPTGISYWSVGGSEQMRLTSTGLGIGTSSPATKLDVKGSATDFIGISSTNTNTAGVATSSALRLGVTNTVREVFTSIKTVEEGVDENRTALVFSTTNSGATLTDYMRLDSSGNLGIGTSSPGAKLDVAGPDNNQLQYRTSTRTIGIGSVGGVASLFAGSGTELAFNIGGERMRLDSSGNLGIGTSSPSSTLQVGGGSGLKQAVVSGGGYDLVLGASGGSIFGYLSQAISLVFNTASVPLGIGTNASQPLIFGTNATERMRLDSSGNLGIGTSSPVGKLQVGTTGTTYKSLFNTAVSNAGDIQIRRGGFIGFSNAADSGNSEYIYANGGALEFGISGATALNLNASGNLGLGVTPSAWDTVTALQIRNASLYGYSTDESGWQQNAYYASGWKYISTGYAASQYIQVSGTHRFFTAPSGTAGNAISFTQAMTLTAAGFLGIGTTSPSAKLAINDGTNRTVLITTDATQLGTSGMCVGGFNDNATGYVPLSIIGSTLQFGTGGSERARIDSSGNLLVGCVDTLGYNPGARLTPASLLVTNTSGSYLAYLNRQSNDGIAIQFARSNSGVGDISVTTTATSYNTSSDYRLKENIAPMTGALAKVAALKPCTYNWKADGSDGEGFIAHELAEVVPQCVTGEKDAVDADGKPKYQGIDTSFLVATLTAAIQEQQAIIESLKARLDAANL